MLPQRHPPLAQPSARAEEHEKQAAPAVPQELREGLRLQVFPEQQPAAQVVESQTQVPLWQRWLAPQTALFPQEQTPTDEQVSARMESHAVQLEPPAPQWAKDEDVQLFP